jgi:predicted transcriptional regulator
VERLARQFPDLARQVVQLHTLYTQTRQRLDMMDETIGASLAAGGRLPWEEVRDWFHHAGNYVDALDRAAEDLAARIGQGEPSPDIAQMQAWLASEGVTVVWRGGGPVRRYDARARVLTLDSTQPLESSRFQLAYQVCAIALADGIAGIVAEAPLRSEAARHLLAVGLGNYAAGALTMPYTAFAQAARALRHDVDRLRQPFHTSFEQVCHRLSTLQRPQARGIPVFFCRVDMAGNVTKRHSATRLQFGRYGGACPLWIVHEAVAIPDRIHVQLAEMPDGVRYVSIAKGLVKPSGPTTGLHAAMPWRWGARRRWPASSSMPTGSTWRARRRWRGSAPRAAPARATLATSAPSRPATAPSQSIRRSAPMCPIAS